MPDKKAFGDTKEMQNRIGELLKDVGLISPEMMEKIMRQQEESGERFIDILKREVSLDSLKALMKYEITIPFFKRRKKEEVKDLLLQSGLFSSGELSSEIPEKMVDDDRLEELIRQKNVLTEEQLSEAKAEHERTGLPLWRTLMNLKMIDHTQISELLKSESGRKITTAKEDLISEVLVNTGLISPEQMEKALDIRAKTGKPLMNILLEKNFVSFKKVSQTLSRILDIPYYSLREINVESDVLNTIPEHLIREHRILPIKVEDSTLTLGMVDPLNQAVIDRIQLMTGLHIKPVFITSRDWSKVFNDVFKKPVIAGVASEMERILRQGTRGGSLTSEDASAVQLASAIIEGAINARATDIHLEPQRPQMRVRYRIDGMLYDVMSIPEHLELPLISRIKLLSNMDITNKREPQDGHFNMFLHNREFNFRTATIPTYLGEKMTIRFLDEGRVLTGLKQLGFEKDDLEKVEKLISRPHGLIVVTGPVGSGKTTTLYAALNQINVLNLNVITIEDPIEYRLTGINQIQVNPDAGVDFKTGLRAILRHDADIIMVGEVRDSETAKVATWAALTGQLVFCTLHTKDAAGAVTMMENLGVEPYIVASSMIGIIAQRLVRKLCPHCKEMVEPNEYIREKLGLEPGDKVGKAVGCRHCFQTGYSGRTGVFEVLEVNSQIQELILQRQPEQAIRRAAIEDGMKQLLTNGIAKIKEGITTPEEVLREMTL